MNRPTELLIKLAIIATITGVAWSSVGAMPEWAGLALWLLVAVPFVYIVWRLRWR